jgi:uncharacterized protein YjbI with pentapeptide repeats
MRSWSTPDDLAYLGQIMEVLKKSNVLEPSVLGVSAPLDLRGLTFPTVTQCKALDLPTVIASRVAGHLEFNDDTLRDVDFSKARLDFSVWNDCLFERICFDGAKLKQVRFFGCRFVECSFRFADLRDSSFAVGQNGIETEIASTVFEASDFRGASCSNPILRSASFLNCKFDGFVFDGALCEGVVFTGRYKDLTFRGIPTDTERNRLQIDLSNASIVWLNVDYGIDLSDVVLPVDGSCLIIKDRLRAVASLCSRLPREAGHAGGLVAHVLKGLFSDSGVSTLESTQDTILISKEMIADFAETDDTNVVSSVFNVIRTICQSDGFLVR